MKLKELKIGKLKIKNNVFLAPLAGYSHFAMREVCKEMGVGLTFTEMVSCKGLKYNSNATKELLYTSPKEDIKAVQIFGNDPEVMGWAAQSNYLKNFDVIDINMGCPVNKIYKNGEGSALLNDFNLAGKIIESVKKSGKVVSVKFRIGLEENKLITRDFSKLCEDSGADFITIHGRVRLAMYAGEVNYDEIKKAKEAVKIPVIANGGVFSLQDADNLIEKTGADGIMVARGAIFSPWIFSDILKKERFTKKEIITKYINRLKEKFDDKFIIVNMRKQIVFFMKGSYNSRLLKERILHTNNLIELEEIIDKEF